MAALWRLCQILSMRDELSKEAIAEPRQLEIIRTQIGKVTKARVEFEMKTELNPEIKEEPQPKPEIKHEPGVRREIKEEPESIGCFEGAGRYQELFIIL